MIISFGWTTPALLAGQKTVTRRDWKPQHASKFHAGMVIDAWNTSPRNTKGNPHKVATIRLTAEPKHEHTAYAPASDWYAEGFDYLQKHELRIDGQTPEELWDFWAMHSRKLYVVRFEVVGIEVEG